MQAKISNRKPATECQSQYAVLRKLGVRSAFLFINFFLIILAYYQVKPASRSLFIEALGPERFPYVWMAATVTIGVFITYYHRLVARVRRLHVVLGTCLSFGGLLVVFRVLFNFSTAVIPFCFYIFMEIFGLVLVEQFWSLTDSIFTSQEGKSWYGMVGVGGLVGGVAGGSLTAVLIEHTALKTPDLLLTAAATLGLISGLTLLMERLGLYCEVDRLVQVETTQNSRSIPRFSRYLVLISLILLLAQLASPLIEYQFMNRVAAAYPEVDPRTAFLGKFNSGLGLVGIVVNLGITPFVLRFFGPIAGLLIQPVMIGVCSWGFFLQSTLFYGGLAKISDRGLSYSINRAAKELLYVPLDPVLIYQAKAWIDMFGYRLAKGSGSLLILLFTQWLPFSVGISRLSWFTIAICAVWIALVMALRYEYRFVWRQSADAADWMPVA